MLLMTIVALQALPYMSLLTRGSEVSHMLRHTISRKRTRWTNHYNNNNNKKLQQATSSDVPRYLDTYMPIDLNPDTRKLNKPG